MPNNSKAAMREVTLRVRLLSPPSGVLFCIQGRIGEFFQQTRSDGSDLTFEAVARVADTPKSSPPRLLGHSIQGPPTARFLYICSGTYAGEASTPWSRRAKVPLVGITNEMIFRTEKKGAIQATIAGTARDGGPACATVPLVRGWTVVG